MAPEQAFFWSPGAENLVLDPLVERRSRKRVWHGKSQVIQGQCSGKPQRVQHRFISFARVEKDEEGTYLQPGAVGGFHRKVGLRGCDLFLHQLQDAVISRLDAKVN